MPTLSPLSAPAVWVIRSDSGLVTRVEAEGPRAAGAVEVGEGLWDVAAGGKAVWLAGAGRVLRLDPDRGAVVAAIETGGYPHSLAVSAGAVWVAVSPNSSLASRGSAPTEAYVVRIDPVTNQIVARIAITASYLDQIAVGEGAVWVTAMDITPGAPDDPRLIRIDPQSNQVTAAIPLSVFPLDLAAGLGAVWLTTDQSSAGQVLVWLDPATQTEGGRITLTEVSDRVALDEGAVWVTGKFSGVLMRVDAAQKQLVQSLALPATPLAVAASAGVVWVTGYDGDTHLLMRVDPSTGQVARLVIDQAWKVAVGD